MICIFYGDCKQVTMYFWNRLAKKYLFFFQAQNKFFYWTIINNLSYFKCKFNFLSFCVKPGYTKIWNNYRFTT